MISKMNRPAWFIVPYWTLFFFFVVVPVVAAVFLSFTYFNAIQAPTFVGITNYIELITMDKIGRAHV